MTQRRQPRLITPQIDPASLLGPNFTPEPGWGGRLAQWLRSRGGNMFRSLVAFSIIFYFLQAFESRVSAPEQSPSPTPVTEQTISVVARPGEGLSAVAARALTVYADLHPSAEALDPVQRAFALDALARSAGWRPLSVGEVIAFTPEVFDSILAQAVGLTISQRSAWARYVK